MLNSKITNTVNNTVSNIKYSANKNDPTIYVQLVMCSRIAKVNKNSVKHTYTIIL